MSPDTLKIVPEAEVQAEGFPSYQQVLVALSQLQFSPGFMPIGPEEALTPHFVLRARPPTMEETIPFVIFAPQDTQIALHESARKDRIVVPFMGTHDHGSFVLAINHRSVNAWAGKLQGDPSGSNAIAMKHHINEDGTGGHSMMDICVVRPDGKLYNGRTQDIAFIAMFVGMDVSHPRLTSLTRGRPLNLGAAVVVNAPTE